GMQSAFDLTRTPRRRLVDTAVFVSHLSGDDARHSVAFPSADLVPFGPPPQFGQRRAWGDAWRGARGRARTPLKKDDAGMWTTDLGACECFVWVLRRSNLIDRGQLDQVIAESLNKNPGAEPPALAEYLVRQGVLTEFQADRLLQGKTQGFVLG